ncbi:MAG: hypothetical protein Q9227_008974 [Pyrenula ochraceoflavens]
MSLAAAATPSIVQSEQAELKVLWEDEMKDVNAYVHHKHVVALLLYWENKEGWTDMETEAEVDQLANVLENVYKFQVKKQIFRETKSRMQSQMNRYLSEFIDEFDKPEDTLLIIYYAGHGWALPGGRGELKLSGNAELNMNKRHRDRLSIHWNKSEHILQDTYADILLILDCCHSGALTHRDRSGGRRFEFLAACGEGKTTRFPCPQSFTSALIWALGELAKDNHPFSTCKLRGIIENSPEFKKNKNQKPVVGSRCPPSNRFSSAEHIMIERLGSSESAPSQDLERSDNDEALQGDYVDLRLQFKGAFDKDQLKVAAKEMRDVIRNPELPLRSIGFVRKGNRDDHVRQAVEMWRRAARRKKGSPLAVDIPERNADNGNLSHLSPSIIVSSASQSTAVSPADEETVPLLSDEGFMRGATQPLGIQYHFKGLLKCIWSGFLGCFRRGNRLVGTLPCSASFFALIMIKSRNRHRERRPARLADRYFHLVE